MIDLGKAYWNFLLTAQQASALTNGEITEASTVWTLFVWSLNKIVDDQGLNFNVTEMTDPGYDYGVLINGTDQTGRYIDLMIATEGTGLSVGLAVEINSTIEEDFINLGIANMTDAGYDILWANGEWQAFMWIWAILMIHITVWQAIISIVVIWAMLGQIFPSSSSLAGTPLSAAADTNQTKLSSVVGNITAVAAANGFGQGQTGSLPTMVPGFELLLVLLPIGLVVIGYILYKRKRIQYIP